MKKTAKKKNINKKEKPIYVALFESENKVYLLMTHDNDSGKYLIHGFESLNKGLSFFTNSYNRAHDRSYESSMSACINYIFFKPRIAKFDSIKQLESKLLGKDYKLVELSHVSGYYTALTCNGKNVSKIYDEAKSPELITPKK